MTTNYCFNIIIFYQCIFCQYTAKIMQNNYKNKCLDLCFNTSMINRMRDLSAITDVRITYTSSARSLEHVCNLISDQHHNTIAYRYARAYRGEGDLVVLTRLVWYTLVHLHILRLHHSIHCHNYINCNPSN